MSWGAIAGAVGGVASSLIGSRSSSKANKAAAAAQEREIQMQRETNAMQIAEALKNREFQYEMSSSAHQREVSDLRKAGLNPILSAGGSGASTPAGNMPDLESPGRGLTANTNSANQVRLGQQAQQMQIWQNVVDGFVKQANINQANSQAAKNEAETRQANAQTLNIQNTHGKITKEQELLASQVKLNNAETINRETQLHNIKQELEVQKARIQESLANARLTGNKSLESKLTQEAQELQLRIDREANEARTFLGPSAAWLDAAEKATNVGETISDLVVPFKFFKKGGKK